MARVKRERGSDTPRHPVASAFLKHRHKRGCEGDLFRRQGTVNIDKYGRLGNGGWVAHVYECNRSFDGCKAKVLVTEVAVREIAVNVEVR